MENQNKPTRLNTNLTVGEIQKIAKFFTILLRIRARVPNAKQVNLRTDKNNE
jgi:hypothetical protein